MRGNSTAGCIRGTGKVSQGDSAAALVQRTALARWQARLHRPCELLIFVRQIMRLQCCFSIISMAETAFFFLAFRPFGTILLFLTRVQTYAQKMKRCRAVFRRPSALLWPPHIV
jgi:hypothetical protein